jgi:hypothetical protein
MNLPRQPELQRLIRAAKAEGCVVVWEWREIDGKEVQVCRLEPVAKQPAAERPIEW